MLAARFVRPVVMALALLCPAAASACDGLSEGPSGMVTAVYDGNTVKLDSGIVVRLLGTKAPSPVGRRTGSAAEPLATAAALALRQLVLNQAVRLGLDDEETDRYGHMEAQLFRDGDNLWVQQAMLAEGVARVEPLPKARRCLAELIAAEAAARANGLGIWADPYYSVRDAADPTALAAHMGHYELVEGEVVGTGEAKGRIFLDFGRVWKDDVTATIDQKARRLFVAAGLDPVALKGQRIRVRGWVEDRDGPLIEISLPEQIEVLSRK
ncbi:MAG: thermonuclease family protein [Devosia sp.]|nr:thermonuclease family protein [Devosia sp.]